MAQMHKIAGVTSNTVPWEILRAAGFRPRLLEEEPGPTPYADRLMEDVFDSRIRVVFDRLCAGTWLDLSLVVIPRTSEQEHKLYLYLREAERLRYAAGIPRLYLYNLLHTRTPESYSYGLARTQEMVRDLGATEQGLQEAIEESNAARDAVRRIQKLRHEGRCPGTVALQLVSGFYAGDRRRFAREIPEKLRQLETNEVTNRPRILIKGAPLSHAASHELVEKVGGYVVAEDDWRGSRAAGVGNVQTDIDPVMAIFEKYFFDEQSPRVHPPEEADAWFHREMDSGRIDGVVFYEPLADDVAGWSYPRQLATVRKHGIPSLLIREDGRQDANRELIEQLGTFLQNCVRA